MLIIIGITNLSLNTADARCCLTIHTYKHTLKYFASCMYTQQTFMSLSLSLSLLHTCTKPNETLRTLFFVSLRDWKVNEMNERGKCNFQQNVNSANSVKLSRFRFYVAIPEFRLNAKQLLSAVLDSANVTRIHEF